MLYYFYSKVIYFSQIQKEEVINKFMTNIEILNYIYELNQKYMANDGNGIYASGPNYTIINGNIPILLSAPHAVRSFKSGKAKGSDALTGSIVEYLCSRTGAFGIIRTFNLNDEPNSENNGHGLEYKKAIINLVNTKDIGGFIDIHGCKETHPFDFDIGTNNGLNLNGTPEYLDIILKRLSAIGKAVVDKEFKASLDTNICNYIGRRTNLPALQIEINSRMRKNTKNLLELLGCFDRIIKELSKEIEKKRTKEDIEVLIESR